MNIREYINNEFKTVIDALTDTINNEYDLEMLEKIATVMAKQLNNGYKIIWFGNGGSAADAQHLAAELVGRFRTERKALPSIAITVNSSVITALSNDYDFSMIFSRQIEALCNEEDVCVGISTSGKSENVINGLIKAKEKKAITIGFTGANGKSMGDFVDHLFVARAAETSHIQEEHIVAGHIICGIVEKLII
ncbi:MAG: SIS domain-containing protein [Candidatus Thermoplasmatota archaeon]|jgi:D-sedoheptulose 7-phosphate isomerase|nr:SIS domain-containing protein [Candidatus Thermoplasmatota archaeon]MCL5963319.1 SIS domain-containing protein [Candidatus Thermoplasmatota archaeon]